METLRRGMYETEKAVLFAIKNNDPIYFYPENSPLCKDKWVIEIGAFESNFYSNYKKIPIQNFKCIREERFLKRYKACGLDFSKKELVELNFTKLKGENK